MTPGARRLDLLPAPEAATAVGPGSIVLQPLGAVEQHGPHLPSATDLLVADAVARELTARYGDQLDLWLLPTLPYTRSVEHAWAPGTVWLETDTMLRVLAEIGAAVATLPARRLVFVNAHGGNTPLLDAACRDIRRSTGLLTFFVHPMLPADHGGAAGGATELGLGVHAGHDETSLMLHLHPELVRLDAATEAVPRSLAENEHVTFGGSVGFGWLADDLGADGVIGDPTTATAEHGELAFEALLGTLGAALAEVAGFELPAR